MNDGKTILLAVWACGAVLIIIIHAGPGKTAAMKSAQPPIPAKVGPLAQPRSLQQAGLPEPPIYAGGHTAG